MASRWPWVKVAVELPDEEKFVGRPNKWRDIGIWVAILCKAQKSPVRGSLYLTMSRPVTPTWLRDYFGLPSDEMDELLEFLRDNDMIGEDDQGGMVVVHFFERQYDKPSDRPESTSKRKKESRSRHAESRRESESDTDEDDIPPTPQPVDKSRLAQDTQRTGSESVWDELMTMMTERGIDLDYDELKAIELEVIQGRLDLAVVQAAAETTREKDKPTRYFRTVWQDWQRKGIRSVADVAAERRRGRA